MVSGYGAKIVECSVGPLKTDEDKQQKPGTGQLRHDGMQEYNDWASRWFLVFFLFCTKQQYLFVIHDSVTG